jgi:hypothetical protein
VRLTPALAACAAILVVLAAGLRPDAFYVGDQGVKLVATRNAILSPSAPFDIPLPDVAGEHRPHVEPFFAVHGDHAHAITSELFPLVSAPLLVAFGMRGLYVLPALGFLGTLLASAWLGSVLDPRRQPALVVAAAALGTPFLFYGLEFWEHMPAVALATAGAALLFGAARRSPGRHSAPAANVTSGLLMGAAIVLRPEAACFAAAVMLASRAVVHRPTWRSLGLVAVGIVGAQLPLIVYSVVHFGTLVAPHVGTNAGLIEGQWWSTRLDLLREWMAMPTWRPGGPARSASFWAVGPAVLVALISLLRSSERRDRGALWTMAIVTVVLVLLTAPNSGGSQWGPRYLLFAYVPLSILAADFLQGLMPARRLSDRALVVVLLVVSAWIGRAAYRDLRGTKALHGQIVDLVHRTTAPDTAVVTDVWWLDQLAAPALERPAFFFADHPEVGRDILRWFGDHRIRSVTVLRSREESADVDSWSSGTCYAEVGREELDVRALVAIRLEHRCGDR